jgi:hypothetical protein
MQVRQEMRTFPLWAIGLALLLLVAVLLAGATGYAIRGAGSHSPAIQSSPAVDEQTPDGSDRDRTPQPPELPYVVDGLAAIPAVG